MGEKDKEHLLECVRTFTHRVASLFLGRKGVVSGKAYLLADAGASSPPRCEVLVQTSFVFNVIIFWDAYLGGNHSLLCKHYHLKVLSQPQDPAINTTTLQASCSRVSCSQSKSLSWG